MNKIKRLGITGVSDQLLTKKCRNKSSLKNISQIIQCAGNSLCVTLEDGNCETFRIKCLFTGIAHNQSWLV